MPTAPGRSGKRLQPAVGELAHLAGQLDVTPSLAAEVERFRTDVERHLWRVRTETQATEVAHRTLVRHPLARKVLGGVRWLTPMRRDGGLVGWSLEPIRPLGAVLMIPFDGPSTASPDWPSRPQIHLSQAESQALANGGSLRNVLYRRALTCSGSRIRLHGNRHRRARHGRRRCLSRASRRCGSRAGPGEDGDGDGDGSASDGPSDPAAALARERRL